MQIGEKYRIYIEKITNLGLGLGKVNNFVIFVYDACPQDTVEVEITKVNKNFAYANIVNIIEASKHRVTPFCPMQKICGACQLQYIDYKYQLELKREIVQDTIRKIGGLSIDIPPTIPSPKIKNFRHKVQYPISETKNSKRILAGYYKQGSHEIVNIKYCPIQPEICDDIIEYIRTCAPEHNISGFVEKTNKGLLRHVIIRCSEYNKKCLVTLVVNTDKINSNLKKLCNDIYNHFEDVIGICVNFNSKKTNVIMGEKTLCVCAENYIEEKILNKVFLIGANTFFQVNPLSAENIFKYVKDYITKNFNKPLILDAYAGISAFGICLSDGAEKVVTIEENEESVKLARISSQNNNIKNIEIHGGDAGQFFKSEKRKYDVIILDPPRKGCSEFSLDEAARLSKGTIIYVSCNPATLARDLKYLKSKGATIESIQPFDMFCHSYHVENVAIIKI